MFLHWLKIENLRSLKNVAFDFCTPAGEARPWTLLLGENGCGKSTVLRAIGLILAGNDAFTDLVGDPDAWIANGQDSCRISARLATQKGDIRNIELKWSRGQTITQILTDNQEGMEPLNAALAHSDSNYPLIGYGASRRLPSGRGKSAISPDGYFNRPRANAIATLMATDAPLNALDSWAMDLEYSDGAKGMKIVREALSELLPKTKFLRIDKRKKLLIFDTPDGEVPLQQLSDGYQNMAGWCGDLLYRLVSTFGHRKNPLMARGLLLVDEIDLHLHPLWQRELRRFIAGKLENFQVIATTHSPLTAQESGEGEIFTLHREPDGRVMASHYEGAANNLTVEQIMTGPTFGVGTTRSTKIEAARKEWKATRSASSKATLEGATRPTLIPAKSETRELLKQIRQELSSSGTKKKKPASRPRKNHD